MKKQAKQIISEKTIFEHVKPKILPHLINKLNIIIENIEEIETIDCRLKTQFNFYGKRYQVIKKLPNNLFCNEFFTQKNIDNVNYIVTIIDKIRESYIEKHLENIVTYKI